MYKKSSKMRQGMVGPSESQNPWIMSKKRNIYDSYGVLESIAWIWRALGIFPFKLIGLIGMKKYRINKYLAVYSILLCSSCIFNYVFGLHQYRTLIKRHISIPVITISIRTGTSLMCMIIISYWRTIRYKELPESIETMVMQEVLLEKMSCRLNYASNAKIICLCVWAFMATFVILMLYDFYASIRSLDNMAIRWIFWIIPTLAQLIDLSIFVSLVGLIGLKFRALNKKIEIVVLRANASSPKIIVTSDVCAENLQIITKAHYNICAVGKRINSIFSSDVVINVITAFIILSTTLYYIFVEVQREGETNYIRIGTYVHWEIIHSAPIVIVVAVCNWTSQQSSYAGKLIHKIRVDRTDSQLYDAMKSFSLQLHHQKLEFTAHGFFPLNSTLLQTMVGNITTYLIILIQFQPKMDAVSV